MFCFVCLLVVIASYMYLHNITSATYFLTWVIKIIKTTRGGAATPFKAAGQASVREGKQTKSAATVPSEKRQCWTQTTLRGVMDEYACAEWGTGRFACCRKKWRCTQSQPVFSFVILHDNKVHRVSLLDSSVVTKCLCTTFQNKSRQRNNEK